MTSESTNPTRGAERDEIYVGYLPVPPGQRRFLRGAVPGALLLFLIAGGLWTSAARSPGDGQWDTDKLVEIEGMVSAKPYGMLRCVAPEGGVRTLMLVNEGKHGAADTAAPFEGRLCTARGHILRRDGRELLELSEEGLKAVAGREASPEWARPAAPVALGRVSLRGEIIDPKCYFGAMKPGEGKTHKECAALCISGGIPPMFITRGPGGQRAYYLLTNADTGPASEIVIPYIGEPVEAAGQLERWGDLLVLRLDPTGLRRL